MHVYKIYVLEYRDVKLSMKIIPIKYADKIKKFLLTLPTMART